MLNNLSLIPWISSDLLGLVSSFLVVSGRLSIMAAHTEPWITIHDTTKENPNHYSSLSQISSLFFFLTQTKNIWKKNLRFVGCNAYAGFPPSCRLLFSKQKACLHIGKIPGRWVSFEPWQGSGRYPPPPSRCPFTLGSLHRPWQEGLPQTQMSAPRCGVIHLL